MEKNIKSSVSISLEKLIPKPWKDCFNSFPEPHLIKDLEQSLSEEYKSATVFPAQELIFNALNYKPAKDIKVVIIGQDPYHTPGAATGLAFAVDNHIKIPPSLRNIIKELKADIGTNLSETNLLHWAEQGVLLLNTSLTVREGEPASHTHLPWKKVCQHLVQHVLNQKNPLVLIQWGRHAQEFCKELVFENNQHQILSPHPSPFSANRGFFGSKPFSLTNKLLLSEHITEVNW